MTGVGYGDLAARTPLGRFISIINAICGAVMVAMLVTPIAHHLTLKPEELKVLNEI